MSRTAFTEGTSNERPLRLDSYGIAEQFTMPAGNVTLSDAPGAVGTASVVNDGTGPDLKAKKFAAGSMIALTNGITDITIATTGIPNAVSAFVYYTLDPDSSADRPSDLTGGTAAGSGTSYTLATTVGWGGSSTNWPLHTSALWKLFNPVQDFWIATDPNNLITIVANTATVQTGGAGYYNVSMVATVSSSQPATNIGATIFKNGLKTGFYTITAITNALDRRTMTLDGLVHLNEGDQIALYIISNKNATVTIDNLHAYVSRQ